jgi:hypothetical protein
MVVRPVKSASLAPALANAGAKKIEAGNNVQPGFQRNVEAARFRQVASAPATTKTVRFFQQALAKALDQDRIRRGREAYASLGSPVKEHVDRAVGVAEGVGLGPEARDQMAGEIARVLKNHGIA